MLIQGYTMLKKEHNTWSAGEKSKADKKGV